MNSISCIYVITNTINKKIYIGKTKNFKRRMKEYKSCSTHSTKKSNYCIMNAIRKYGYESFKFEILEEVPEDKLNDMEKFYIDKYNSRDDKIGYNSKTGGVGGSMRPSTLELMSSSSKGFRHTDEEKNKRKKPIITYNTKTDEFDKHDSSKDFGLRYNFERTHVTRAIRKGCKVGSYYCFYQDKETMINFFNDIVKTKKRDLNTYKDIYKRYMQLV